MRTTYHITTHGDEELLKLKKVCKFLGAPIQIQNICAGSSLPKGMEVDTIIELSKYELLYVRLTVNIQDIKEIKDNNQNEAYS